MNKVMQGKKLEIVGQEMEIKEDSGLPIGKIEIKHEKKCRNDIRHFKSMFEIDIKQL
jgi:hypothetical protein